MGVTASADVGVAEKVCAFIMLISSAFMKSMSAFVAQNYGAGLMIRACKALHYGVVVSFSIGIGMFLLTYFHGNMLAGIFSSILELSLCLGYMIYLNKSGMLEDVKSRSYKHKV